MTACDSLSLARLPHICEMSMTCFLFCISGFACDDARGIHFRHCPLLPRQVAHQHGRRTTGMSSGQRLLHGYSCASVVAFTRAGDVALAAVRVARTKTRASIIPGWAHVREISMTCFFTCISGLACDNTRSFHFRHCPLLTRKVAYRCSGWRDRESASIGNAI